jgi:hypothetical protein
MERFHGRTYDQLSNGDVTDTIYTAADPLLAIDNSCFCCVSERTSGIVTSVFQILFLQTQFFKNNIQEQCLRVSLARTSMRRVKQGLIAR